jgi:hypothetical protein
MSRDYQGGQPVAGNRRQRRLSRDREGVQRKPPCLPTLASHTLARLARVR